MKKLYSKRPSDDLILKGLLALGFSGWESRGEVEEASLDPVRMWEVLDELRACYFPAYAKTYLDKEEFNYYDFIIVVRQMLRLKQRQLVRRERTIALQPRVYKTISFYSLSQDPNVVPGVSFD